MEALEPLQTVIARWESKRGKDWVEVYEHALGYCYEGNGCGGWFADITRDEAIASIADRVERGEFCSQKSPMRKVV
jgi:hypothetical protein